MGKELSSSAEAKRIAIQVFNRAGADLKKVEKGTRIFTQGDSSSTVALVNNGIVTEDRAEKILYINGPGDCIDLSGASSGRYSADARAITPVSLYVADRNLLLQVPEWRDVSAADAKRKQARNEAYIASIQQGTNVPRVALSVIEFFGETDEQIPLEMLARRTGLTRRSITTRIGELCESGVINRGYSTIEIVDMEELSRIASGK